VCFHDILIFQEQVLLDSIQNEISEIKDLALYSFSLLK